MSVDESLYLSTLRLSNSINSKYKKYINGYKELSHVKEKPFIIAVAPFDQPNFQIPNLQPILRILYGVDTIYKMGNYISNDEFKNIINKNGAKVSLGLFTDNGLPEVSAILFSCVGTTGKARAMSNEESVVFLQKRYAAKYTKPLVSVSYRGNSKNDYANKYIKLYAKIKGNEWKESLDRRTVSFATPFIQEGYKETLFDGLHLFLNPFANGVHKINDQILELFKKNGVTIHTYNKETKTYECIYPVDGTLLQRSVELIKYVCM